MTGQVVAHELAVVELCHPLVGITDDSRVLAGQRPYHLLLAYKEVGAVVVQGVDGGERAFTVGNEHVSGYGVVAREADFDFAGAVAVALFLGQDLYVVAVSGGRRRGKHAVEDLLAGGLAPLVEVLDGTVSPCHRVGEVLDERVGVDRQVATELELAALLRHRAKGERQMANDEEKSCQPSHCR